MSSLDNSREKLTGLTLDDVLANQKRLSSTPPKESKSRTLLDIIKEDDSNKKDRRSWKAFQDTLRLKLAGSAWRSSIHIPTSDPIISSPNPNPIPAESNNRNNHFQHMSNNYNATQVDDLNPYDHTDSSPAPSPAPRAQFSRRSSTRYGSPADSPDDTATGGGLLRPQLSRRNSTTVPSQSEPYRRGRVVTFRDNFDDDDSDDERNQSEGRTMSAREAVAAQEASEAAAAEAEMAAEEEEEERPMTMSLMDLLEETDREMGLEGSRYILSDDEDFDEEDEDFDEDCDDDDNGEGSMEYTCCICMVKHKGSAFIPCGHTFCRMCSRELNVSRGNCPLCNNFILEILDIF
ncbi:PREDICTED: uncharacterized protein LOC109352530 isoform X2 [Lupinus angustifolius]|nr:PREDICTED: uncharacterized protein LOC109352530 isoform X2 [Lupinus angustifolius]